MVNVCKGVCSDIVVYSEFDGSVLELIPITSGIIQGCPMSGWLYAVATDPVDRSLVVAVELTSDGTVRAVAHDVGAAMFARKRACSAPRAFLVDGARGGPPPHMSL